jgi:hypothetical protein
LGANTGRYTRLATELGAQAVAFDRDPGCVERGYRFAREAGCSNLFFCLQDLANPSPALGWAHSERMSLAQRGPVDVVMALALVHHLAIGNNVPFRMLARFLHSLGRHLIVEWVPKTDPQVQRLLAGRKDVFADYSQEAFEQSFQSQYTVVRSEFVEQGGRILYLMESLP